MDQIHLIELHDSIQGCLRVLGVVHGWLRRTCLGELSFGELCRVVPGLQLSAGSVLVNGKERTASFRRYTGYVQQDSAFFPSLTVREVLRYTALLRLPYALSTKQKYERVEEVEPLLLTPATH